MSERLIGAALKDVDGLLVIEELVGEGNCYRFLEVPMQGPVARPGVRFQNARFYDAMTARREWFLGTGQRLTWTEVIMEVSG